MKQLKVGAFHCRIYEGTSLDLYIKWETTSRFGVSTTNQLLYLVMYQDMTLNQNVADSDTSLLNELSLTGKHKLKVNCLNVQ